MSQPVPKAHTVYLFTNRNCLVFDVNGLQIPELQRGINCYGVDPVIAQRIANEASEFFISKHGTWSNQIDKKSFEYMLGLRTRERDLAEMAANAKI